MERYADLFKKHVINFKLELCCFMATVRTGLLALAWINIAIGYMTLMFFVEESFEPLLLKALNSLSSAPPNYSPSCLIVYAVELGSNVLLLSGIIRNDLVLLRVYMNFALGVLTAAVLVYSVMFSKQTLVVQLFIIVSVGYQIYIILLVRSTIVEIKQSSVKNGYKVNFRQSSIRYSRPGSKDKYSVVIEPYKPRRSLVPVVKETNITKEANITKEEANHEPKEAAITVQSPAKKGYIKGISKEGVAKEDASREAKDEAKEAIEPPKRKRSFFGRKEKVKKVENQTKSEN